MKTLLAKAQLTGMKRYSDRTVGYNFRTLEEIDNDNFALSDQYYLQNGWVAFKMNEMEASDLPKEDAAAEGMDTPSQYLRRCLYAKFMATGGKKENFAAYYNKAMAGFAEAVNKTHPERTP